MGQTPDQPGVVDFADRVFVGFAGLFLLFFGHALVGDWAYISIVRSEIRDQGLRDSGLGAEEICTS